MIKLDVHDYCHECHVFSPYLKIAPHEIKYDCGEKEWLGEDCVVGCLREKTCRWVEEKVLQRTQKEEEK